MRIRAAIIGLLACAPIAHAQSQRTITLVNQCPFPVYPGATVGTTGTTRTTNADCGAGQFCGGLPLQCYWNPLATGAGTTLDAYSVQLATNASLALTIPVLTSGAADTVWSGGIWAGGIWAREIWAGQLGRTGVERPAHHDQHRHAHNGQAGQHVGRKRERGRRGRDECVGGAPSDQQQGGR